MRARIRFVCASDSSLAAAIPQPSTTQESAGCASTAASASSSECVSTTRRPSASSAALISSTLRPIAESSSTRAATTSTGKPEASAAGIGVSVYGMAFLPAEHRARGQKVKFM